jgi:hypothetical protein
METFADSVVAEQLAMRDEVDQLIAALYKNARDRTRFVSVARTI